MSSLVEHVSGGKMKYVDVCEVCSPAPCKLQCPRDVNCESGDDDGDDMMKVVVVMV